MFEVWDEVSANLIAVCDTREEAEEIAAGDESLFVIGPEDYQRGRAR